MAFGYYLLGKEGLLRVAGFLPFPLMCIWMPEDLGNPGKDSGLTRYYRPTPWFFVALGGWLVLLVFPLPLFAVMAIVRRLPMK
jgi:hypothetical protein